MVSAIAGSILSFIFTTFVVVLILNMMHEGDYTHFIKVLIVSAVMLFVYPITQTLSPSVAIMVNSFIAWTALLKITSEGVTFGHAAITALAATVFASAILPLILGFL